MSRVDWLIVVEGVAGGAAVVSAVVAVVGAVSARTERKGAEEAAETAKRHMEAAESDLVDAELAGALLEGVQRSGTSQLGPFAWHGTLRLPDPVLNRHPGPSTAW
jgi:hypothetical protein